MSKHEFDVVNVTEHDGGTLVVAVSRDEPSATMTVFYDKSFTMVEDEVGDVWVVRIS